MRRIVTTSLAFTFLFVGINRCTAQDTIPSVVQLPTFNFFSFQGTVVVPDSGAAFLGGNRSAAIGSNRQGLGRAFGMQNGISQASIHATIIDLNEMDELLLGGTREDFLRRSREARLTRAHENRMQRGSIASQSSQEASSAEPEEVPVNTVRRTDNAPRTELVQHSIDPDKEGKALVRHARALYKNGDQTGSFDTYRLAIANLKSGRLRELARAEFKRVFGAAADQSLRMATLYQ